MEHVQNQAMLGHVSARGAHVTFATCGGGLGICDRANTYESPPMPCRSCSHYTRGAIAAHGFGQVRLADFGSWSDADPWDDLDTVGIDQLTDVEWNGLPLGQLVDIPVKWFLVRRRQHRRPTGRPSDGTSGRPGPSLSRSS
ncbi:MAG: hypothetical protein R2696_16875 [Microthrixaceae bacterium]